jgi:hypothetical protein
MQFTQVALALLLAASNGCMAGGGAPPEPPRSAIVAGDTEGYPRLFERLPIAGFVLSPPPELVEEQQQPWGHEWRRGLESVWIGPSHAPDYPAFDGLGPQVEATTACDHRIAGVLKSFMLPAREGLMATDVLFFTREHRGYQVGYSRPVKSEPADDVLEFMSTFCGT